MERSKSADLFMILSIHPLLASGKQSNAGTFNVGQERASGYIDHKLGLGLGLGLAHLSSATSVAESTREAERGRT